MSKARNNDALKYLKNITILAIIILITGVSCSFFPLSVSNELPKDYLDLLKPKIDSNLTLPVTFKYRNKIH